MKNCDERIYSYLKSYTERMNEYDQANFRNNMTYYKEGSLNNVLPVVIGKSTDVKINVVNQAINNLKDLMIDVPELVDFFDKIHDSPILSDLPLTMTIRDTNVVEKIRPEYLQLMAKDVATTIDGYLNHRKDKDDLNRIVKDNNYVINMKKQLVRTSLPYDVDAKEVVKYNRGTMIEFNEEFITLTILPFLRNLPHEIKSLDEMVANISESVAKANDDIFIYTDVMQKMFNDGKISHKEYHDLNMYFYKSIRNFTSASSFVTFCALKKITDVQFNLMTFIELRDKIMRYHPEGISILHESVMDGSFDDIDTAGLVTDALRGRYSTIRSILNTMIGRENSDYTFNLGVKIDGGDEPDGFAATVADGHQYNPKPYDSADYIFNTINDGLELFRKNLYDVNATFSDILNRAGFSDDLNSRFSAMVNDIQDVSAYDKTVSEGILEPSILNDAYLTLVHEIYDADKRMTDVIDKIHKIYTSYSTIVDVLSNGDVSQFSNRELAKGLVSFITNDFDSQFQQLVLSVLRAFISRFKHIDGIIDEVRPKIHNNPDINGILDESADDYDLDLACFESDMEMLEISNKYVFSNLLQEYYSDRVMFETGMRVVYEADNTNPAPAPAATPAPAPATNTTTTTQTNTSQNDTNTNQNTQQNTNTNTQSNTNTSNANQGNQNKVTNLQNAVEEIKKKNDNYYNNQAIPKLTMAINSPKANENIAKIDNGLGDAVKGRNFGGVTVRVADYSDSRSKLKEAHSMIQKAENNIKGLTLDQIKQFKNQEDANKAMFGNILNNTNAATPNVNNATETYVKAGPSVAPGRDIPLKEYNSAAARELAAHAVDTVKDIHSTVGPNMLKELETVKTTVDQKLSAMVQDASRNMNESVDLYMEEPAVTVNDANKDGSKSLATQLGYISTGMQRFVAGVCDGVTDINREYLSVINKVAPASAKNDANANNQNNANNQQPQQNPAPTPDQNNQPQANQNNQQPQQA